MSETQVTPWDEINVDEVITEQDHAASNDISMETPVGVFVCAIVGCDAVERTMDGYSCYAANLKMKIESVLKIEKPLLDDAGKPIKRNGEIVKKVMDVALAEKETINAMFKGRFIIHGVNLYNSLEKDTTKNRRFYIAKQIGLISKTATAMPTSAWPSAIGRKVIITTERNSWRVKGKDGKETGEVKENVRVAWDGFTSIETLKKAAPHDAGANAGFQTEDVVDTSFNPKEFDI